MQVLYLVEVLLMTFDLLTFGNSQQVNDCHLVLIITYLLQWSPLQSGLHLELIFVPNAWWSVSTSGASCTFLVGITLPPFQSFTLLYTSREE